MQLPPKEVRKIAATIPNCREIKSNAQQGILSFILMDSAGEPARIHVYCQSGTVGICRVLNHEVREMFERKCNLRQVLECFSHPSKLPNVDQNEFRFESEHEERQPTNDMVDTMNDDTMMRVDMASLKHDEQIVDIGLSILAGEFDNLMTNFKSLVRERQRQEREMEELDVKKQEQMHQNHQKMMHQQHYQQASGQRMKFAHH